MLIHGPNECVVLVDVYMPSIRQAQLNRSVNRTVTLPAWLNALAMERNINFSQVLQQALKDQLNLKQYHENGGAGDVDCGGCGDFSHSPF